MTCTAELKRATTRIVSPARQDRALARKGVVATEEIAQNRLPHVYGAAERQRGHPGPGRDARCQMASYGGNEHSTRYSHRFRGRSSLPAQHCGRSSRSPSKVSCARQMQKDSAAMVLATVKHDMG